MDHKAILLLLLAALTASAGQLYLKLGAQGRTTLLAFANPKLALGLALYFASAAMWIYVLSFERLVNVYAFTALTFVLVYLGGVVLLGERITFTAMIGVGLVLLGLFLITLQSN